MGQANIKSISYLKHNTADLIADISTRRRPATITQNGEAKVVVMDVHTYDEWRDALAFSRLMGLSEHDVGQGNTCSNEEAFDRAEAAIRDIENER